MKCLLVIDVQNGFVSDTTRFVLPRLQQLITEFSEGPIIATKFVNLDGTGFTDIMHWGRLKEEPETALIPFVEQGSSVIMEKNTYTAYIPEVSELLKKNDIHEVFLAGIDTDCCVLATAISLFEHNVRPIVLEYYCASNGGQESHSAALRVMDRTIGRKQIFYGTYPFSAEG